jgi:hypothetical protein
MSIRAIPVVAAVAAAVLVPAASATRPATTEPNALKMVKVTVTAKATTFAVKRLERGTIADFRITNRTRSARRLVVAGVRSAVVKPGQTGTFLVHLDVRGKVTWTVLAGSKRTHRGALVIY